MADNEHRIRLVLLGGAGVGKSSIIQRFLNNSYTDKYKSTVEDLYNRDYDIGPITLKVDILDTAGDCQFPAMRRLSIANAHAFLLVYSINEIDSFDTVQTCLQDIREQRSDFEELPIIIAGNKSDLEVDRRVFQDDVTQMIAKNACEFRCRVLECSAKENQHISDIFRMFLRIGRLPTPKEEDTQVPESGRFGGFRRQSSAYSKNRSIRTPATAAIKSNASTAQEGGMGSCLGGAVGSSIGTCHLFSRNKPRSRSLIRRASHKAKQKIKETPADDCTIT